MILSKLGLEKIKNTLGYLFFREILNDGLFEFEKCNKLFAITY
jgi:hypothetical protein